MSRVSGRSALIFVREDTARPDQLHARLFYETTPPPTHGLYTAQTNHGGAVNRDSDSIIQYV